MGELQWAEGVLSLAHAVVGTRQGAAMLAECGLVPALLEMLENALPSLASAGPLGNCRHSCRFPSTMQIPQARQQQWCNGCSFWPCRQCRSWTLHTRTALLRRRFFANLMELHFASACCVSLCLTTKLMTTAMTMHNLLFTGTRCRQHLQQPRRRRRLHLPSHRRGAC